MGERDDYAEFIPSDDRLPSLIELFGLAAVLLVCSGVPIVVAVAFAFVAP
jgi:hypothetical protein